MKIAVWHNLPSGGGKRALYNHVRGLIGRGHNVKSWCPSTADISYQDIGDLLTENVMPFSWPEYKNNNRVLEFLGKYKHSVKKIETMDRHCRICADEISREKFDVLFANSCMFYRVPSIARYVKVPKIIYLQEPYRWLYEAMPRLPWVALDAPDNRRFSWTYAKQFVRDLSDVQALRVQAREELLSAKYFDNILVNSLFSRESILRAYGLNSEVCYLGIDTGLFHNKHVKKEHSIVGIGAFVPEKNIDLVIQSIGKTKKPRPHLIWIGNMVNKTYLQRLTAMAESLDVDFRPLIKIADSDIVNILNQSKAMVYAPRLEPFGFAPLEANACGLPVIAVAEGGVRETIIDNVNGLLVKHDSQAIAEAINRILCNDSYAQQLGESGEKIVNNKWSLEKSIDRIENCLLELISDNSIKSNRQDL